MPEKRRSRATASQAKVQRAVTQTTLKDHFQRTGSGVGPTEKLQDIHLEGTEPEPSSLQTADSRSPPAEPSQPPKPSKLFPIFTKFASARQMLRDMAIDKLDDNEVIDITDTSDVDLSTEPALSFARQLSPCSGLDHAASPSPPSSINDHGCESDTSLPHAITHEDTRLHKISKPRASNKRTLGFRDVAPLPGSCSQHVRGLQHCYTFTHAPLKRSLFPSISSSDGTLDFLARSHRVDGIPSISLNHDYQSLTPHQCEEHLRSISRDCMKFHPVFARISVYREKTPLDHTETWTRRFRPRRASEVLGNEQRAIYLRDWLSAHELHSQERQPKEPAAESRKGLSKRAEPRGVKRPRVIRAVTRKRSKKRRMDSDDDLDDFVVFSDADEGPTGDYPEDSEDELAFCQRTAARLHGCDVVDAPNACPVTSNTPAAEIDHTATQTQFADNLTNTLLITGPPGCGKTAAVYACAEELGWEVFEVYPGIGKRSGANLDLLVGDVGRNHIVQRVQWRAPAKTTQLEGRERVGLRGYLATSKRGTVAGSGKSSQEAGTAGQPISIEGDEPPHGGEPVPRDEEIGSSSEMGISGMCYSESDGSRPIVGQSLVLLEEVDILFKEDAGFWPAVVEFIQCCQRPVVMTCNDLGLVPVGNLPLQKILVFEPCASMVAATFLQCLSLREGWLVPHADLMALYESTHAIDGLDVPDAPLYPRTGPLPLPDLRRAIMQLQMLCAGARHGSTSGMHQGDEAEGHVRRSGGAISAESRVTAVEYRTERELWRQMKGQAEVMSRVDAELRRGKCMGEEVGNGGEDEEVGYVGLCSAGTREGLSYYERDELIAEEAIRHSRGEHEEDNTVPMEASINAAARVAREEAKGFRARVEYQSRMEYALQEVLGAGAPLAPQRSVFLDYIPWVRYMVATDDEQERRVWETGRGRGRFTRNSMRTRHVRAVAVGEGQRAALMAGQLGESGNGSAHAADV